MEWTGERLETFITNETMVEHLHRYALALDYVADKTVLDIACGEGYGANLLAKKAKRVVGADISQKAIDAAKNKYVRDNLSFLVGDTCQLDMLESATFDVVISFETLEHHDKHDLMLTELKRVLKPDGKLIISTPDKYKYSDMFNYDNPFHVKELYAQEFKQLIQKRFKHSYFFHQQLLMGSLILPELELPPNQKYMEYEGNYKEIKDNKFENGMYLIAIASEGDLSNSSRQLSYWRANEIMYEKVRRDLKNTWNYRVGNFIVAPLSKLKKLFTK